MQAQENLGGSSCVCRAELSTIDVICSCNRGGAGDRRAAWKGKAPRSSWRGQGFCLDDPIATHDDSSLNATPSPLLSVVSSLPMLETLLQGLLDSTTLSSSPVPVHISPDSLHRNIPSSQDGTRIFKGACRVGDDSVHRRACVCSLEIETDIATPPGASWRVSAGPHPRDSTRQYSRCICTVVERIQCVILADSG